MAKAVRQLSVNQLVSETRKACLGKGVSYGMADDIAKAVQLLARHQIVPQTELVAFLQAPLEVTARAPDITDKSATLSGKIGLLDVATMLDFVAGFQVQKMELSGLLYPVLSHGLIALSQNPAVGSFTDETGKDEATPDKAGPLLLQMPTLARDSLSLRLTHFQRQPEISWPARVSICASAYETIKAYAHESYVPSSQLSRDAGAGAGLNDND